MYDNLSYNALTAWTAFGLRDYAELEKQCEIIYNYFVKNPLELLSLDNSLLFGKVFQISLGFQVPDKDIQEVKAENAFICFSQALESEKIFIHDEAAARLMMLLIKDQVYLSRQIERSCLPDNISPGNWFGMLYNDLPKDMPLATNTKILFLAYYLYNTIIDKSNVSNEFINIQERSIFEKVRNHVLDNCNQFTKPTPKRIEELGKFVFDKYVLKLTKDIKDYSEML